MVISIKFPEHTLIDSERKTEMVVEIEKEKELSVGNKLSSIDQNHRTLLVTQINDRLYRDFKTKYFGSDLFVLFDRLVTPLLGEEFGLEASKIQVERIQRSSRLGAMAADVVNFSYNSRYVKNGGELVDVSRGREDFQGNSQTLVAKQQLGDRHIVLATFRVVYGGDLDTFNLFELIPEKNWPHTINKDKKDKEVCSVNKPGELERFSLHPIFDFVEDLKDEKLNTRIRDFKQLLLREMWPYGMEILRQNNITHPYFILAPNIRKFVISAGIHPTKVEDVIPRITEYATGIRYNFKEYWKPDGDLAEQPTVYLAPREVTR